jgi:hypothetical protein
MNDKQRLDLLLRAEAHLKKTTVGFEANGPNWKAGMPMLWKVRQSLGNTADGRALADAHGVLKMTAGGYNPYAPRWKYAMKIIDRIEAKLHPVPGFGPVIKGEKPMGLWAPTHNTDGLHGNPKHGCHDGKSWYPAFDSAFGRAGAVILAPERLIVKCQSSAAGADAFYADGASGLEYWFGHLVSAPATGRTLERGEQISRVARISARDGGPHLHVGIDARRLLGRDLLWGRNGRGPDYTFGSPTIGQQLAAALAA